MTSAKLKWKKTNLAICKDELQEETLYASLNNGIVKITFEYIKTDFGNEYLLRVYEGEELIHDFSYRNSDDAEKDAKELMRTYLEELSDEIYGI